jgi:PAS domain S-box-containing protein
LELFFIIDVYNFEKKEIKSLIITLSKFKKSVDSVFGEIFNHFNELFYWIEDVDNSSVFYSENFVAVTGFSVTEIKNRDSWLSLILRDDLPSYRKTLDMLESDAKLDSTKINYRITRKDGSIVHLSEKIKVLRGKNGKIKTRIGLVSDISEFSQLVEELRIKNEQLELLNSSKDSFLSILSHDLRAPFTSILGFSEIILNETKLPEKDKAEYVKFIYDSSNNQLQLINHLFDWSQIQTGRFKTEIQPLHAQSIVYNCVSYLTGLTMRKNININVKVPDSFNIDADERLVTKVFLNLLSNAIKFSFENELVELTANIYNNNFIEFIIKDKGVGIPEANRRKIFNIAKLFTTEGTKGEKGSGLGLMLAKQIVENHGGEMWFFSEEGKGSEFHFTIPSATSYVLIVLHETRNMLELEEGIVNNFPKLQVLKAENGFEAIEIISEKSPSLIIIEHSLPLMDGVQLIRSIRDKHKQNRTPFIVFIDSESEELIRSYQEINVKLIKEKPSLTDQLKEKIESLLYN